MVFYETDVYSVYVKRYNLQDFKSVFHEKSSFTGKNNLILRRELSDTLTSSQTCHVLFVLTGGISIGSAALFFTPTGECYTEHLLVDEDIHRKIAESALFGELVHTAQEFGASLLKIRQKNCSVTEEHFYVSRTVTSLKSFPDGNEVRRSFLEVVFE